MRKLIGLVLAVALLAATPGCITRAIVDDMSHNATQGTDRQAVAAAEVLLLPLGVAGDVALLPGYVLVAPFALAFALGAGHMWAAPGVHC